MQAHLSKYFLNSTKNILIDRQQKMAELLAKLEE
jgi:hypothetical protein